MAKKNWKDLKRKMTPEARERVSKRVNHELLAMNLSELRRDHSDLTQEDVASLLEITQSAISQIEKRSDASVKKLAEYVKALGGRLELVAHFEDRADVRITQFEEVRGQIAAK